MVNLIDNVIGVFGLGLILTAFILNEFNYLEEETFIYNLINLIGSGCLIYYSYALKSWIFAVLNTVWFLVSGWKTVRISIGGRK